MTPAAIHRGQAHQLHDARARVLEAAFARNPERFVNGRPVPPEADSRLGSTSPTRRRPLTKVTREASHWT